jgi:hypothetical protein
MQPSSPLADEMLAMSAWKAPEPKRPWEEPAPSGGASRYDVTDEVYWLLRGELGND